jgi:hypothetical protein
MRDVTYENIDLQNTKRRDDRRPQIIEYIAADRRSQRSQTIIIDHYIISPAAMIDQRYTHLVLRTRDLLRRAFVRCYISARA